MKTYRSTRKSAYFLKRRRIISQAICFLPLGRQWIPPRKKLAENPRAQTTSRVSSHLIHPIFVLQVSVGLRRSCSKTRNVPARLPSSVRWVVRGAALSKSAHCLQRHLKQIPPIFSRIHSRRFCVTRARRLVIHSSEESKNRSRSKARQSAPLLYRLRRAVRRCRRPFHPWTRAARV